MLVGGWRALLRHLLHEVGDPGGRRPRRVVEMSVESDADALQSHRADLLLGRRLSDERRRDDQQDSQRPAAHGRPSRVTVDGGGERDTKTQLSAKQFAASGTKSGRDEKLTRRCAPAEPATGGAGRA